MKILRRKTKRTRRDVMIMNAMKRKKNCCMARVRKLDDNNKIEKIDYKLNCKQIKFTISNNTTWSVCLSLPNNMSFPLIRNNVNIRLCAFLLILN